MRYQKLLTIVRFESFTCGSMCLGYFECDTCLHPDAHKAPQQSNLEKRE